MTTTGTGIPSVQAALDEYSAALDEADTAARHVTFARKAFFKAMAKAAERTTEIAGNIGENKADDNQ